MKKLQKIVSKSVLLLTLMFMMLTPAVSLAQDEEFEDDVQDEDLPIDSLLVVGCLIGAFIAYKALEKKTV